MRHTKAGLGAIVPALLNPGTAAALAIGLVGWGVIKLLGDDDEDGNPDLNGLIDPPKRISPSELTVDTPLGNQLLPKVITQEERLKPEPETVAEPFNVIQKEIESSQGSDAARQDMIRQYMSELGKRSAAARAKKRVSENQPSLD